MTYSVGDRVRIARMLATGGRTGTVVGKYSNGEWYDVQLDALSLDGRPFTPAFAAHELEPIVEVLP
ncbi:MAG: hypothetical protein RJA49_1666 [Actinomycetota bacterium]|jgi:hypothetical protein